MLNELKLVVDCKTHQLIGIFDVDNADKFYVSGDVIMDGKLFKNGVKYAKDEYIIWNIELNKEYEDCRIRVSDGIHCKKKVS